MTSRRLGIFGGTFDPVHVGHLVAAVNARHALDLDTVLLVVANVPWQKVGERTISDADLALLPMFLLIRDMAQMGWFHQRPELPRAAALPRIKARICAKAAEFEPLI